MVGHWASYYKELGPRCNGDGFHGFCAGLAESPGKVQAVGILAAWVPSQVRDFTYAARTPV